jgi:hypothetical protein
MQASQSPVVGMVIGTVVYILLSVIILSLFNQLAVTGSAGGTGLLRQVWSVWLLLGVGLGVADGLVLIQFITSGGRR